MALRDKVNHLNDLRIYIMQSMIPPTILIPANHNIVKLKADLNFSTGSVVFWEAMHQPITMRRIIGIINLIISIPAVETLQ